MNSATTATSTITSDNITAIIIVLISSISNNRVLVAVEIKKIHRFNQSITYIYEFTTSWIEFQ